MFSLLLTTWDWSISNIHPIFTFQGLIHLQIYVYCIYKTLLPEEIQTNVASGCKVKNNLDPAQQTPETSDRYS